MRAVLLVLLLAACGDASYDLDGGDLVTLGKRFVELRGCPSCHQSSNPADGTLAGSMTPVPKSTSYAPNLTSDHLTGIGDWADIEVTRTLRFGVDKAQHELCPTMPRFTDITDLEARAIVAYLRSLPVVSNQVPNSMCPPVKPLPEVDMSMPMTPDLAAPPDLVTVEGGG